MQRRTGPTFHIATRLFPRRIRHATYVLYAFFRLADEVVDDPHPPPPDDQRAALEHIREVAVGNRQSTDPVLDGFAAVRKVHDIPASEVEAFIDAMLADVSDARRDRVVFDTEADRTKYLRGSAVAVAYMMLAVMNPPRPSVARPHARALGEAFQLTNFIRDVREDIDEYDRVYIPRTRLDRAGVEVGDICAHRCTSAFRDVIRAELEYAETKYRKGVAGIGMLPEGCRFPVLLAAIFYAEYHRLIRGQGCDVLSDPPSLRPSRYLSLIVRSRWHWFRTQNAEAVFYRVSPIDPSPSAHGQIRVPVHQDRPGRDPTRTGGPE